MKTSSFKPKVEQKLNSPEYSLRLESAKTKRDHFTYNLYYKNVYLGILQISFGSREFGKKLIGLMSRQLGISSQDLRGIEDCTFWAKDFIRKSRKIRSN